VLIQKKFKSKPVSQAEHSDSTKTLTPGQLLSVIPSHQTIHFESVNAFKTVAKSFSISNNLPQNILMTFNYEYEELNNSSPISQVIPSNKVGHFDILFCSSTSTNLIIQFPTQLIRYIPLV
jgi:hypothetical protein